MTSRYLGNSVPVEEELKALRVRDISLIQFTPSTSNYSTTPLGSGETYTGTAELNGFTDVGVSCYSDTDGTLYFDFRNPGSSSWRTFPVNGFAVNAGIHEFHTAIKLPREFRVRFVNGSSAQAEFELYTYFGTFRQANSPANAALSNDADAISTRPSDFRYEAALNRRGGVGLWNKFGYNNDISIGTEILAAFGGTFAPLTTASTLTVVSSSSADDSGGTGANSLILYGVDANRISQIEVVTLDGLTPVVTTTTWLGVNRAAIYVSGSGQVNAGTITITATTGGATQATIPVGEGTSQQCIFFTQDNHTALMDWMLINVNKISGGASPVVTIKGWVYSAVSNSKYEVFRQIIDTTVENSVALNPSQPFVVGEKSAFWLNATTNTNSTVASARFSLLEVKDA